MLLFAWLFISTFYQIDLKSSLSNADFRKDISNVENSKDINELKNFTKAKMYNNKRLSNEESQRNEKILYIIFILITIQLFLYLTTNNSQKIKL